MHSLNTCCFGVFFNSNVKHLATEPQFLWHILEKSHYDEEEESRVLNLKGPEKSKPWLIDYTGDSNITYYLNHSLNSTFIPRPTSTQ